MISLGAALGASLRYACVLYLPMPILIANVLGSFTIGYIQPFLMSSFPQYTLLINVGLLGSLTTFSSFSLEVVNGLNSGDIVKSMVYGVLSLLLCIGACYLGASLSK